MQHNALCTQGTVEGIRNVHRAHWRGCPDLADSPCCFSLAAHRQTLGGRGAASSLAPSSLRQQRVRLPPTRSSSARPRRPPEERLGAAAGLGVAHPARAPRLSRSGGHSAGHTGRLRASAGTCRVPPSRRFGVSGPRRPSRARAGSGSGPAPPTRPASRAISSRSPPGTRAAPCRRSRRHRRRAFHRRAWLPASGRNRKCRRRGRRRPGDRKTRPSREPGARATHSLDQNLVASCAAVSCRRLPTAASLRHCRKLG